jgi:hypothetical protein
MLLAMSTIWRDMSSQPLSWLVTGIDRIFFPARPDTSNAGPWPLNWGCAWTSLIV